MNDEWFRRNVRSRHAHRPIAEALTYAAYLVVLFLVVLVVPLLWGQP